MEAQNNSKQRMFIALIPSDEVKLRIYDVVNLLEINPEYENSVKYIPFENYHITLQFLGDIASDSVPKLIEALNSISIQSFNLKLNNIGYFKRSHVLWLGVKDKPVELEYLVDACFYNIYNKFKFEHDLKRNNSIDGSFTPHITLLKRVNNLNYINNLDTVKKSKRLKPNIEWSVDCFYLVRSILSSDVVKYEIVEKFC